MVDEGVAAQGGTQHGKTGEEEPQRVVIVRKDWSAKYVPLQTDGGRIRVSLSFGTMFGLACTFVLVQFLVGVGAFLLFGSMVMSLGSGY